jgi:hypothetical protein
MFRLIAIDFSQKSPHFSLLSPTSPCELSEREVTSSSNLKVVGALDNYSLVFVIFINFFGQLKDWVGQVLFLISCPKGQVEKYVNVEACTTFNNILAISWQSILLVGETGVPGENSRPAASHRQTLSQIVAWRTPHQEQDSNSHH